MTKRRHFKDTRSTGTALVAVPTRFQARKNGVEKSAIPPPRIPPWIHSSSSTPASHFLFTAPPAPRVFYTDVAWSKLQLAIHHCAKEVGWFGTVERTQSGNFLITDIFVLKQEVTAATTEIDGDALNALYEELFQQGKDPNQLRYWGHSHVNMAVSPSINDEEMVQEYVEDLGADDFFIRGIYNKRGASKVDVYIKQNEDMGWIHECVENTRVAPTFAGATDFVEAIKRDVVVYVPPTPTKKRNTSSYYESDERWASLWDEDGQEYQLPLSEVGDFGMVDNEAAASLLNSLDMSAEDAADPFKASGT